MIRATIAQARFFILQKNYLAAQKATNLPHLAAHLSGLPASPLTTPFLAARARLNEFRPADLLAELGEQRRLMQGQFMRNSAYIIPSDQYLTLHAATTRQRNQAFNAEFRLWGIERNETMESLGQAIMAVLGDQALPGEAIAARLEPGLAQELSQTSRGGRVTRTSNIALALRWLNARGLLYATNIASDWRSETLVYARLDHWYPELDLEEAPDEAEAQKRLVRNYLAAFGPATEADISLWTGLGKSETARASGALSGETTLALVEGIPGMLLMFKNQAEALQAVEPSPEPLVNLLPADDPYTTAHRASRSRYFTDQKLQRQIFSSSGEAKPAIVVNGEIVGVWDWQTIEGQDVVTWQLLVDIDSALVAQVETEVERLASFIQPQTIARKKPRA
jgi:hypothetical protein